MEVRYVPVLDQASKLGDHAKLRELSEAFASQDIGALESVVFSFLLDPFVAVGRLVRDGGAGAAVKVDEVPWLAVLTSSIAKHFSIHDCLLGFVESYRQHVGCQSSSALSKFDGDLDRPGVAATHESPKAARLGNGGVDVLGERVLEELEHVEQSALPGPVRTDHDHQLWQVGEGDVLEQAVVLDVDLFDSHLVPSCSSTAGRPDGSAIRRQVVPMPCSAVRSWHSVPDLLWQLARVRERPSKVGTTTGVAQPQVVGLGTNLPTAPSPVRFRSPKMSTPMSHFHVPNVRWNYWTWSSSGPGFGRINRGVPHSTAALRSPATFRPARRTLDSPASGRAQPAGTRNPTTQGGGDLWASPSSAAPAASRPPAACCVRRWRCGHETGPAVSGKLYVGYPMIPTPDGTRRIDALLASETHGLVAFDLVQDDGIAGYQERQDDFANAIESKLRAQRNLVRRSNGQRRLVVPVHAASFAPSVSMPPDDEDYPVVAESTLGGFLDSLDGSVSEPDAFASALSLLESMSAVRRPHERQSAGHAPIPRREVARS